MFRRSLALILSTSLLTGCVGAFIAGAATGGLIVYDRRDLTTVSDDQHIRYRVNSRIVADPMLQPTHISVTCFHYAVLLVGQTPNASQRAHAEKLAQTVTGFKHIYNEIEIAENTTPKVRTNDAWITTKVKAQLLTAKDLNSGEIKVVTENSTVYLLGQVSQPQADLAVAQTKKVSGVKRIVKVFQYR
jgi:osmotically-inducible protein OsmY